MLGYLRSKNLDEIQYRFSKIVQANDVDAHLQTESIGCCQYHPVTLVWDIEIVPSATYKMSMHLQGSPLSIIRTHLHQVALVCHLSLPFQIGRNANLCCNIGQSSIALEADSQAQVACPCQTWSATQLRDQLAVSTLKLRKTKNIYLLNGTFLDILDRNIALITLEDPLNASATFRASRVNGGCMVKG